ncbi:cleavage polyadenylation factor subunit [Saccharomycopsis crataegensis]|uniref:mRNA 3'-end-processing protein RNA14 n=1 Tax=Saccharomycopsis crataegensis TaxID=43959 RepID=A0AAV5QJM6_9ASCO|nr:cleavage polyadenylation factor subunit [Saccharomycopsis crataegensis]
MTEQAPAAGNASLSPSATPAAEVKPKDSPSKEPKVPTFIKRQKLKNLDTFGKLDYALQLNERDITSWKELITKTQNKHGKFSPNEPRKLYERFLKVFPNNGDIYLKYIDFELSKNENSNAESLYERSLTKCRNLELWKSYINYVRKQNDIITGGQEARQTVNQSFDIALRNIGIDLNAGSIWEDYIKFINEWNPISKWEEQQKTELKRKTLKQSVIIPSHKIEDLWTMYTTFENEVNPSNARKYISDTSPQYMLARTWYKEFTGLTRMLNSFSKTPAKMSIQSHKTWINLEKQNKLRLSNRRLLNKRIEFAFVKTLEKYPFYPEIWFEFAQFKLSEIVDTPPVLKPLSISTSSIDSKFNGNDINSFGNYKTENLDTGISILTEGLLSCPMSPVLTYLLAELYELKNDHSNITAVFDSLIDKLVDQYDQLSTDEDYVKKDLEKPLRSELESRLERLKAKHTAAHEDDSDGESDDDNQQIEETEEIVEARQTLKDPKNYTIPEVQAQNENFLKNIKTNKLKLERLITTVYINYIKFTKRAIKKSVSRTVFKDARKRFKNLTWHIYFEEAMFEYNTSSNSQSGIKIALKIFDTGMKNLKLEDHKNFPFLVEYFKFLILVNDYTNIKSFFEVCVKNLTIKPPENLIYQYSNTVNTPTEDPHVKHQRTRTLQKLFKLLLRYELYNGNILAIQNLQHRYKEIFPEQAELSIFSQIYREYDGLNLLREFEVDIDSNVLFKSWTDYSQNINNVVYKDLPKNENNYKSYLSDGEFKVVSKKLKEEHLIESYDSSSDLEDDTNDDGLEDFDMANYGFKSRSQALKVAKIVKQVKASTENVSLKRPRETTNNNSVAAVNEDDYVPSYAAPSFPVKEEPKAANTNKAGDNFFGNNFVANDSKPFVSDNIYNLLRVLPSSASFDKRMFNSKKLVDMLKELNV